MAARNGARFLAPVALVATVAAIYFLVNHELAGTSTSTHTATHEVLRRTSAPKPKSASPARFHTIQSGETLSSIAQKTGVSVSQIEALNPGVNPNALQTGQRLRLSRS